MQDLNREIVAEEIFESQLYAVEKCKAAYPPTKDWKNESEFLWNCCRLQADYLLSKFRMILKNDNETPKPQN